MFERDHVLLAVRHVVGRASEGAGSALFVLGDAGLGKTTVLRYACTAADGSMAVGVGHGAAMESALPFALWGQAFAAVGDRGVLDAGPGSLGAVDAQGDRFYRAYRWLETAGPMLLGLDDLHWSDPESLSLLSFLVRRIRDLPVAVIGTLRPWPPPAQEVCRSLSDSGVATVERLRPLSPAAAGAMLRARVGGLDEDSVERAVTLCGGNPLLLEQVAGAVERGESVLDAGVGPNKAFGEEMLLARFAGISRDALDCARAGSVLGTRFRSDVAAEVARLGGRKADDSVEALCRSGLVRERQGVSVEFAHPLFGQALYEDLPVPLRSRLHARAFAALMARGMHTEAAEHAVRGELRGNPVAVAVLADAGTAAFRSGAPATAAQRFAAAVDLAGDSPDPGTVVALGEALVACGRPEAREVCERALSLDLNLGLRIRALRVLAGAHSLAGDQRAAARFDEAVALAETPDPSAAVDVLLDHALTAWFTTGPRRSYPLVVRARALADRLGGVARLRTNAAWGFIAVQLGDASGFDALEAAARPLLADPRAVVDDLYSHWGRLSLYGATCTLLERLEEGDRIFRTLGETADRIGALAAQAGHASEYGYLLTRMGRLDDALALLHKGIGLVDVVPFIEPYAAVGIAYILLLQGELEESARWCQRAAATATSNVGNARFFVLEVRGHRAWREGRLNEASDSYLELESVVNEMGIGEPCLPAWGRHAVAAHVGCGRLHDARRVVDWLETHAARLPCRFPRIAAATGRAMLAEHDGDDAAADAAHRAALVFHADVNLPVEKVETLLEYGAFLRRAGRPGAARPFLGEAVSLSERIGARWLGGLALDELRVAGGRRTRRSQPDELTPQETRIATLVAQGHTNREIARHLVVSETTVETHLRHIYMKFGIHSRRQLVAGRRAGPDEARSPR